jgi:hypothetical protein
MAYNLQIFWSCLQTSNSQKRMVEVEYIAHAHKPAIVATWQADW